MDFNGKVILNYIDDHTRDVTEADISVTLGIYKKLYEDILIHKRMPDDVGILSPKAIELYFDYLSDTGYLATLVKQNSGMDENEFVKLLLENSKDYGLSDLQAKRLIEVHSLTH